MFSRASSLPFSFHSLLIDDYSAISEPRAYRPDLSVKDHYGESLFIEAFCNEASNVSPISFTSGTEYKRPSRLYLRHFLEVGNA